MARFNIREALDDPYALAGAAAACLLVLFAIGAGVAAGLMLLSHLLPAVR